jgi:hypothetical protein
VAFDNRLPHTNGNAHFTSDGESGVIQPLRRRKTGNRPKNDIRRPDALALLQWACGKNGKPPAGQGRIGFGVPLSGGRHGCCRSGPQNAHPSLWALARQFRHSPCPAKRAHRRDVGAIRQIPQRRGHLRGGHPRRLHGLADDLNGNIPRDPICERRDNTKHPSGPKGERQQKVAVQLTLSAVSRNRTGRPAKATRGRAGSNGATTVLRSDRLTTSNISVEAS